MRVESMLACALLAGASRYCAERQAPHFGGGSNFSPDGLWQKTQVASTVGRTHFEATTLLADTSERPLVKTHRRRFGDLDAPAALLLLPELGHDAESHQGVMQVFGQALRRHRKLNPWIPAHRVDGAIAAHESLYELSQPLAIPSPNATREPLLV